ncbi:MAG TPA: LPS biosynthesis protein [Nitrospiraceae bacterium]|jgi:glycosyltransferase involved in cell wall biosynthesis|nr:LPS biosynthesis protein [Nitrospiraceae bacterium]
MDRKNNLSVAIITKNEEKNLPDCLKSVSFADDIVVVDSGSTDRTVELARGFGCRVFVEQWKGYGPQKNTAIDKCSHDWVLVLDADERVAEETKEVIAKVLEKPEAVAYTLRRKNYLHGKWLKHSGYWPDRQIRLVSKDRGSFHGVIHERWEANGTIQDLDAHIEHYAFSDYTDMLTTLNDYSSIIARELHASGIRTNSAAPLYHGIGMFLKIYFIERGFLDGIDGLVTALLKAGGSFFKYAKLLELQRANKQ